MALDMSLKIYVFFDFSSPYPPCFPNLQRKVLDGSGPDDETTVTCPSYRVLLSHGGVPGLSSDVKESKYLSPAYR